jgi:predicted Zn-dependent protease
VSEPRGHASKTKGLLWITGAIVLGLGFAFGITPFVRAIPWRWEVAIADRLPDVANNRQCKNQIADGLLQRLVARLFPVAAEDSRFTVTVRVVRDSAINAYATLGGNITINSGLLKAAQSPAEVAGVLAHEIEHIHHRHVLNGFVVNLITREGLLYIFGAASSADITRMFLNMRFSRQFEAEADEEGLRRLQRAHIDNRGFRDFFTRMQNTSAAEEFLSDHPSNQSRAEMAGRFENTDTVPLLSNEEWARVKMYCN